MQSACGREGKVGGEREEGDGRRSCTSKRNAHVSYDIIETVAYERHDDATHLLSSCLHAYSSQLINCALFSCT